MRFNVHLPNLCIDTMNGYIETFNTDPPLYGMLYSYIGYDADIYILTGDDELVPISFMQYTMMSPTPSHCLPERTQIPCY